MKTKKISCINLGDAKYLFVTNSMGFEKKFLSFLENLHFRAHMSSAAAVYAVMKTYTEEN